MTPVSRGGGIVAVLRVVSTGNLANWRDFSGVFAKPPIPRCLLKPMKRTEKSQKKAPLQ
jgi:hypothetical protein